MKWLVDLLMNAPRIDETRDSDSRPTGNDSANPEECVECGVELEPDNYKSLCFDCWCALEAHHEDPPL